MIRPPVLAARDVDSWLAKHEGWARREEAIVREFKFADFSEALAFTVRVGLAAEKRDHHPEIALTWGKVSVSWSTHEPKGLTQLDLDLAETCDALV